MLFYRWVYFDYISTVKQQMPLSKNIF